MSETNGNEKREVLRLATNVPMVASLKYEEPLGPYPGRYGDQFMYTLATEAGEKVIYLDPPVSDMIQKLGLSRGEPFRIGKMTRKDGPRRGVEWKVQKLEPEEMAPAVESARAVPPAVASDNGTAHRAPAASERQRRVPQPTTPEAPPPNATVHQTPPPNATAQQTQRPAPAARPHTPVPFACGPEAQLMLSTLVNVVDIVMAVEQYAKAKGRELHFTSADIHAVAATCFIQRARGGGR